MHQKSPNAIIVAMFTCACVYVPAAISVQGVGRDEVEESEEAGAGSGVFAGDDVPAKQTGTSSSGLLRHRTGACVCVCVRLCSHLGSRGGEGRGGGVEGSRGGQRSFCGDDVPAKRRKEFLIGTNEFKIIIMIVTFFGAPETRDTHT